MARFDIAGDVFAIDREIKRHLAEPPTTARTATQMRLTS
ncbi:MAG: hypothetical protein ACJASC_000176 [Limimaricola cinnabarinus]